MAGTVPGCPARKAEARTGRFDPRGCRRPTATPPPLPPACHAPPADLAQARGFVKGKVGAEALVPKAQLLVGAPAGLAVYCDEWTNLFSPLLGAEGRWVLSSQTAVVWPRSRVGVKGHQVHPVHRRFVGQGPVEAEPQPLLACLPSFTERSFHRETSGDVGRASYSGKPRFAATSPPVQSQHLPPLPQEHLRSPPPCPFPGDHCV